MEQFALNPNLIPSTEAEILNLACQITSEPEFSKEQLSSYAQLMKQEHITAADLENNEVVNSCMKQGGFKTIEEYMASDKNLDKQVSRNIVSAKVPYVPKVTTVAPTQLKIMQDKKQY